MPELICLLVGPLAPRYDLAAAVQASGLVGRVISTGYLCPADFRAAFELADVAVNLRYPTAGETSASAFQLLGFGIPLLVSAIGAFSELPDNACVKIPTGEHEVEALEIALRALALDRSLREGLGRAARRFITEYHSPERVVASYMEHFERTLSVQRPCKYVPPILSEAMTGLGLSMTCQAVGAAAAAAAELGLE